MKTGLFYAISSQPEVARQFLADLATALSSSSELRDACLGALPELTQAMTQKRSRVIAERIGQEQDRGIVEVASVLQSLNFLMRRLADEDVSEESADDMATDLAECGKACGVEITETNRAVFRELVESIRERILPQYKELKSRKATAGAVLPSLSSFGSTAGLRPIVGNRFRIGMSADQYDPDIQGLVPVVSVSIGVDSGVVDEIAFQASPEELEALIENLKSALVCAKRLERFAGRSHFGSAPERSGHEEDNQ